MEEDHQLGAEADGVAGLRLVCPALVMVPAISSGGKERLWLDSQESEWATALPWGAYGPSLETARTSSAAMPAHSLLMPPGSMMMTSIPKGFEL
jgi:hypothetical protein